MSVAIVIPNRTKRWFHDWSHNMSDARIDLRIEHGIAFEAWRREREYWATVNGGYAYPECGSLHA